MCLRRTGSFYKGYKNVFTELSSFETKSCKEGITGTKLSRALSGGAALSAGLQPHGPDYRRVVFIVLPTGTWQDLMRSLIACDFIQASFCSQSCGASFVGNRFPRNRSITGRVRSTCGRREKDSTEELQDKSSALMKFDFPD